MGPLIDPDMFTVAHIVRVAPVILGEAAWSLMASQVYPTWPDFVEAMELWYGLSCKQCVERVFRMKP